MRPKMSITAAGDFLRQRRLPERYDGFEEIRDFIMRGDARFFNLETSFPDETCFGDRHYGGSYLRTDASALEDARRYGFNMLSFANNHTMDYSFNGLLCTLRAVEQSGFPSSGVGRNLDEASAPGYLDTPSGCAAVVATASYGNVLEDTSRLAGKQSRRVPGRPGVNELRIDDRVVVTKEEFETLRGIVAKSHVNAQQDICRAEGFAPPLPEGVLPLQQTLFVLGDDTHYETHPNKADMDRIVKSIEAARICGDYVFVSIHSHEESGSSKETPAQFVTEFAHRCIDAGACAVIGHGPHILRPLEIYKGCPIFYSVGNFLFQCELTACTAEDEYEKYGMTSDEAVIMTYEKRTAGHTRGLLSDKRVLEAVIPYIEVDNDKVTAIELMPIELGFELENWQKGVPRPGYGRGILERYAEMSLPYGTRIVIGEDGNGRVELA